MTSQQLDEEAIFHLARRIDHPEVCSGYLDQICAGDRNLRQRVEALLEAHEKEEEFLKSVPAQPVPTVDYAPVNEQPGMTIGRYRLMEQIGEGGMGVVFVAEQTKPLQRKVALKVIKPGMDSKAVIARFEAERQALALMDHPNIAKVLDAGTTDSGLPFFVMELVRGIPITEYCDQNKLTVEERLCLFIQVCQAIQHAHHKGIIHRDIKPTNVLVTEQDGKPIPKVIDFGIAKALNQPLTERTVYTNFQAIMGTPLYMSPEQAKVSAVDVDTRSDVYSLGVLLFELLVGTTPFEKERLAKAALEEACRIIREEEPPSIRQKLSTLPDETSASVCSHRQTNLATFRKEVCGDLDKIVAKTLIKERNRRYESPSALVDDIGRFLRNEPVWAAPNSMVYKVRKFTNRNKKVLTLTSLAVLVLALFIGWMIKARSLEKELIDLLMDDILFSSLSGEPEKALKRLEKSRNLPIPKGWHQMMEGQIHLVQGRYLEAIEKLSDAEKLLGERTAINSMLAFAQTNLGQEDLSIKRLERVREGKCDDFADYLFRGWALSERWPEEAKLDIEKARELRPASHVALLIYAQVLRDLADSLPDPREALKQSQEVLRLLDCVKVYLDRHPKVQTEMVLAHLTAASRCWEIRDEEKRNEHLGAAQEMEKKGRDHLNAAQKIAEMLDGSLPDTSVARANLFRMTGNPEEVLSDYNKFYQGRPEANVFFSTYAAMLFYRQRDFKKAIAIFDAFNNTDTKTGTYAFRLYVLLDTRAKGDLQVECRKIVNIRPLAMQTVQRYADWTICRLLGEKKLEKPVAEGFFQGAQALKKEMWYCHGKYMKGEIGEAQLIKECKGRRFEVAHAHFLIAIDRLSKGDRKGAKESFQEVIKTNQYRNYVSWWSEVFLERLKDPNWLSWLPKP